MMPDRKITNGVVPIATERDRQRRAEQLHAFADRVATGELECGCFTYHNIEDGITGAYYWGAEDHWCLLVGCLSSALHDINMSAYGVE